MIEKIYIQNEIAAIVIQKFDPDEAITFVSEQSDLLQFGILKHSKNTTLKPHVHLKYQRVTSGTAEVLFVSSGLVQVNFYTNNQEYVQSRILKNGDWIVLLKHGHGFEMLEDSIIYEVKNGPYAGNEDKLKFVPKIYEIPSK